MTGRKWAVIAAVLAAVALLAACQPDEERLPPVGEELVAIEKARCEAAGDFWGRAGAEGAFVCFRRMPDAGDRCTRASDCQGACLARSQSCAPLSPLIGCQDVLTSSGQRTTLCLN